MLAASTASIYWPSRLSLATPWLASLALHAAVLIGLALLYREGRPVPPLHIELVSPAPLLQTEQTPSPAAPSKPTPTRPAPSTQAPQPISATPALATPAPATTHSPAPAPTPVAVAIAAAPQAVTTPMAPTSAASAIAPALSKPGPSAPSAAPSTVSKVAARFDAAYLQNPEPPYPAMSRRMGESGTVLLWVNVSAQGTVVSLFIHRSSGFSRLDEAAKASVMRWRFLPARLDDVAIADTVEVPIVFKE